MKLINDFFYVTDSGDTSSSEYRCQVTLNADHCLYRVHFPGNPITPGACLIQMASEILGRHFNRVFLLTKAGSIKFKKTISPHEQLSFVFTKIVFDDNQVSTLLSIENDQGQFARMSLYFKVTSS